MSTEMKHMKEPWTHQGGDCLYYNGVFSIKTLGSFELRNRVLNTLNACAGIAEPATALQKAREALEEMIGQYGCACGHPACRHCHRTQDAQEALRLLTPEKP